MSRASAATGPPPMTDHGRLKWTACAYPAVAQLTAPLSTLLGDRGPVSRPHQLVQHHAPVAGRWGWSASLEEEPIANLFLLISCDYHA